MAVVLDVIVDALRELGVLAAGEVATSDDAIAGLAAMNRLIDQWAAEELQIYQTTRTTWTIVSGTQDYTLGTGGTINVARPVFIDHINFVDTAPTPDIEYQMSPLTDDAWSRVPIKSITAPLPTSYYYNPTYPLGTVSLWPVPTSATLLGVLYAPQAVAEFTAYTTAISLPPGYRRMIVKNLAVEMSPSYERPCSRELVMQAMESKAAVKRANKRLADMQLEAAALIQGRNRRFTYSILTGP
jgi:hypothetical protein